MNRFLLGFLLACAPVSVPIFADDEIGTGREEPELSIAENLGAASASAECDPLDVFVTTTPIPQQQGPRLRTALEQLDNLPAQADIVFVGDSQAQRISNSVARSFFPDHSLYNLGVGGDRTQMVLWRLQREELRQLDPKIVLLLSGGTNLADSSGCAIAAGIMAIVDRLHEIWPNAYIVKIDTTPRGRSFQSHDERRTESNRLVSARLADLDHAGTINVDEALTCGFYPEMPSTFFLYEWLGWADNTCDNYQADMLHWTEAGYRIVFDAVIQHLDQAGIQF